MDSLENEVEKLSESVGEKHEKRLNAKLLIRLIRRLEVFSGKCEVCRNELSELTEHIHKLLDKQGSFEKNDWDEHRKQLNTITAHLQKEHKLVTEGYYMSNYMTFGIGLGMVFGLLLMNNLALGLSIGISLGIGIGAARDADAKKKGITI